MNGEGGIGRAEEDLGYLRGDFVTGYDFGTAFPGGYYPDISVGPFFPQFAAYSQLPAIRDLPTFPPASTGDPETAGPVQVQAAEVIDPEAGQTTTVFEDAPGGIYETNREPMSDADWDRYYDEYVVLNAPQAPEVPVLHGSIDWGNVVGTIVGGAADPFGVGRYAAGLFNAPAAALPGVPSVAAPAAPVRIDPRTGRPVCKRRRRRRLLTDGDFNDLMRISTLPNKDIVKIALAKAVGR